MKAIAVHPGTPHSIHLADVREPSVEHAPDGRGVLVDVLRVGVDGTGARLGDDRDLMFEATGFSPLVFEAAEALGKNGVLVLASVTGGERTVEVRTEDLGEVETAGRMRPAIVVL
jgi:hypothetical protein